MSYSGFGRDKKATLTGVATGKWSKVTFHIFQRYLHRLSKMF